VYGRLDNYKEIKIGYKPVSIIVLSIKAVIIIQMTELNYDAIQPVPGRNLKLQK
jgi:hypothetical protein